VARFYLNAPINIEQTINLPMEIVRHIQVLRLRNNEIIYLFNGDGSEYATKLLGLEKKQATVQVMQQIKPSPPPLNTISLAIGLISSDKMDFVVQKATELGVKEIIPLYSEYAQRIPPDRLNKRLEHWQNIILSSCMQCGQNYIPTISRPIHFEDLLTNAWEYNLKVLLSPHAVDEKNPQRKEFKLECSIKKPSKTTHALLMVGAEGGWSSPETAMAIKHGFIPIKLGSLILRAETAVLAGLGLLNVKLNIW